MRNVAITSFLYRFDQKNLLRGLILLRYSSNDSVVFLSPLRSYSMSLLLQKLLTLTGLFSKQFLISLSIISLRTLISFSGIKRFVISLIITSLIALFSFSSVKRFLMYLIQVLIVSLLIFKSKKIS